MTRKFLLANSLASLAIALPAFAAGNSGSGVAPVPGSLRGTIACRDLDSVPVTADAEQALPMQLVARLACGTEVSLLAQSEGYTVNIQTPEGKTGYVARLYLSEITAAAHPPAEAHISSDGIARWKAGNPGSDQFYSNGTLVESLSADGITVQISLQDTGWKMRASVAIANDSGQNASFNPRAFTLDELTPRLRSLRFENPRELAKAPTHEVYWTNASATAPAASLLAATYKPSDATYVATTNYLARDAQQAQASVLQARTLAPKEKAAGVVWFERDKNAQQLTLRVFVNDQIFEFPLSFPH